VTCHNCKTETAKADKGRNQVQRYKCHQCGKRFTEPQEKPFGEDVRVKQDVVISILHCLLEGNSVRSITAAPANNLRGRRRARPCPRRQFNLTISR